MQAPFPPQESLGMIAPLSPVDIPQASSTQGCLQQREPYGGGRRLGAVTRVHIAGAGVRYVESCVS